MGVPLIWPSLTQSGRFATATVATFATDEGGLFLLVQPSGRKLWKLRYRMGGRNAKQEKVALGAYPTYSLADARSWRDDCKALIERGLSPMALRRGDPIPDEATPAAKELAELFIRHWCVAAIEKARQQEAEAKANNAVEAFAWEWFQKIAEPANSDPRNIKRVVDKDIIPAIGGKALDEVTVTDVLAITDKIKNRGSDQMALQTRNIKKRLFSYAIAREKMTSNPAAAIEAKYVATAKSRDVALTPRAWPHRPGSQKHRRAQRQRDGDCIHSREHQRA